MLGDRPAHPIFAGVGFIFDTGNLEARLSLRATQPDLCQAFADRTVPGQTFAGQVTKLRVARARTHSARDAPLTQPGPATDGPRPAMDARAEGRGPPLSKRAQLFAHTVPFR